MGTTIHPQLLIFWDYDTQWGADRSRSGSGPKGWGPLEFSNTERLLELHDKYNMPACFAVVGAAALAGKRPYQDPDQIRRLHAAGHEVASHSFKHDWLPGLALRDLRQTISDSKKALEDCIGSPVVSFVPPYNQPFDYPQGWSFSLSERREAGRGHVTLDQVCEVLGESGYRFCRVAHRSLYERAQDWWHGKQSYRPQPLSKIKGTTCARLNTPVGFTAHTRAIIESQLDKGGTWVVYGHPHSISEPENPQAESHLIDFFQWVIGLRRQNRLQLVQPRDLLNV